MTKFLGYTAHICDEWKTISLLLTIKTNNYPKLFEFLQQKNEESQVRLSAATSHHDVLISIEGKPRKVAMLLGQRLTEVLRSPGDGILVGACRSNLSQAIRDLFWRVEVRESLREIDGSILVGYAGHPITPGRFAPLAEAVPPFVGGPPCG